MEREWKQIKLDAIKKMQEQGLECLQFIRKMHLQKLFPYKLEGNWISIYIAEDTYEVSVEDSSDDREGLLYGWDLIIPADASYAVILVWAISPFKDIRRIIKSQIENMADAYFSEYDDTYCYSEYDNNLE